MESTFLMWGSKHALNSSNLKLEDRLLEQSFLISLAIVRAFIFLKELFFDKLMILSRTSINFLASN